MAVNRFGGKWQVEESRLIFTGKDVPSAILQYIRTSRKMGLAFGGKFVYMQVAEKESTAGIHCY